MMTGLVGLACIGPAKCRALDLVLPEDVFAFSYPAVISGNYSALIVARWHVTDEATYGVSAKQWNSWIFGDILGLCPDIKIIVL